MLNQEAAQTNVPVRGARRRHRDEKRSRSCKAEDDAQNAVLLSTLEVARLGRNPGAVALSRQMFDGVSLG